MSKLKLFWSLLLLGLISTTGFSQYFGRNKAKYDNFTFNVYNSPNFEIYHYLENEQVLNMLTQQSEQWYAMHQEVLKDTFQQRNPMIFYNDHADFQQTNSISGSIGVGTGGVTEGFKRRVISRIAMTNQQTNHVLGHELVHAFQYHLMTFGDSTSLKSISNIPLWLIEGLAEYMSIGRVDAHTAMWMRDAVLNEDVPTLKDLSGGKYFPYRYGQAFWSFLTGIYGDTIIKPFFVATAQYGLDKGSLKVLGVGQENLSNMWQSSLKTYYDPLLGDKKEVRIGKRLLSEKNSGKINIAPTLSPNGKYLVYLSEKNHFSIELFLANAATGKIIRQLGSTVRDGHLDAFNFIESAGTWSPNSKEFAYVAFKKGENVLIVKNVESGKTLTETRLPGVNAFANPTWSPNGKEIVVSGLVEGQIDLYSYNLKQGTIQQLTDNIYAEMQPQFSPDGTQIAFATDEWSFKNGRTHGKWTANIALMDVATRATKVIEVFNTADNLNPVFDQHNQLLFLSNQDGYRNMYKYDIATGEVYQMTDLKTGISGITEYAPAIHAAPALDRIVYTHFFKGNYTIYAAKEEAFLNKPIDTTKAIDFTASYLPPNNPEMVSIIDRNMKNLDSREKVATSQFASDKYRPKFKLDYVGGGAGVGVAATGFGPNTGMEGSIDFLFSDILGNNQLYTGISLNGEILDFGGQISYVNRKKRVAWGAGLSHVPYRYGGTGWVGKDSIDIGIGQLIEANEFIVQTDRLFEDKLSLFAMFPVSKIQRFEASASLVRYGFRRDEYSVFTDDFSNPITRTKSEKVDTRDPFNFGLISAAWVGDNSFFGMASPRNGYRYRLGVDQYLGDVEYMNLTADARVYKYLKPITIGFRMTHFGRYGKNIEQLNSAIYNIAYPWYVRGYKYGSSDLVFENNITRNQLVGNKIIISNLEIRLPFTGPKGFAIIGSKFLFTELNVFLDGGMAWNNFDEFKLFNEGNTGTGPEPIFSAGVSARINLLGALIIEPFLAWPLQEQTRAQFGVNLTPGW